MLQTLGEDAEEEGGTGGGAGATVLSDISEHNVRVEVMTDAYGDEGDDNAAWDKGEDDDRGGVALAAGSARTSSAKRGASDAAASAPVAALADTGKSSNRGSRSMSRSMGGSTKSNKKLKTSKGEQRSSTANEKKKPKSGASPSSSSSSSSSSTKASIESSTSSPRPLPSLSSANKKKKEATLIAKEEAVDQEDASTARALIGRAVRTPQGLGTVEAVSVYIWACGREE